MVDKEIDEYIEKVIKVGDEGSALLAAICAPTLKNSEYVHIVSSGLDGKAVLKGLENCYVVVHSDSGDPEKMDTAKHASSMIENLLRQSELISGTPVALMNVIDASAGDRQTIEFIGNALAKTVDRHKLAIINGELAILGDRVTVPANVSGTMISLVDKNSKTAEYLEQGIFSINTDFYIRTPGSRVHYYAIFDPKGKPVSGNSDGVGTKTEFIERLHHHKYIKIRARRDIPVGLMTNDEIRAKNMPVNLLNSAILDSWAMKLDDSVKDGADAKVVSDVIDINEPHFYHRIEFLEELTKVTGILGIAQFSYVGNRLQSYKKDVTAFNISGSAVCTIDEERLKNPLKPSPGDFILALRGFPKNIRCNGVSDRRKIAVRLFGEEYQETQEGMQFLEYLAKPAVVLYPFFKTLIDEGIATSVYHMSGGAYNGKFARPLAKHGLFAKIENLFEPDWREWVFVGASFAAAETACGKWPMGNDGFITTKEPEKAKDIIKEMGLESRLVGMVEKDADGRTGVEIKTSGGKTVYFSGLD